MGALQNHWLPNVRETLGLIPKCHERWAGWNQNLQGNALSDCRRDTGQHSEFAKDVGIETRQSNQAITADAKEGGRFWFAGMGSSSRALATLAKVLNCKHWVYQWQCVDQSADSIKKHENRVACANIRRAAKWGPAALSLALRRLSAILFTLHVGGDVGHEYSNDQTYDSKWQVEAQAN